MQSRNPFKITSLPLSLFEPYFKLSDEALAAKNARRYVVGARPGYPCRVSLEDAHIGESVILLPFEHQPVLGPYQSLGPIFVRENAIETVMGRNEIPEMVRHRLLSVRGYTSNHIMNETRVAQGCVLEDSIEALLDNPENAYLHVHNAGPGCFNFSIQRVTD